MPQAHLTQTEPADATVAPADSPARLRTVRIAQTILLACLLTAPVFICFHSFAMSDPDIWWHLRTGEWISIHHAVPQVEPFSRDMAGSPWVAYSWAFELLVWRLFHAFGLSGLAMYSGGMILLACLALYILVHRERLRMPATTVVVFSAMYAMGHMYTPRPWLFTILFFACELGIVLDARRTGSARRLMWLPVIFAAWANVHIQFIDGLLVLALAAAEAISARWWSGAQRQLGPVPLLAALAASLLATLANPYGWRLYRVAHDLATQSGALDKISELQAIPFRDAPSYLVLLLAIASAAILGWQRRVLSFEGALLAFAAVLSFRSQRDVWVLAIVAATVLAAGLPKAEKEAEVPTRGVLAAGVVVAILFSAVVFHALGLNNRTIQTRLEQQMPVSAVRHIQQHGYDGPVFNDFNWGGYLIWNLRTPVTIDGRQNVYGDERMDRSVATWGGAPDWSSDPDLSSSRLVIGPVGAPLIQLLRRDAHYRLAYEDKLAAVFTRTD